MGHPISRREAVSLIAITATGGALLSQQAFAQEADDGAVTSLMPGADVCVITPEATEGPYYFDPALERADITEGRPGVATKVRLQVADARCAPIAGARVDLWHCDATGLYSGYANQTGGADASGETFMRGTLFADAAGIVEFITVYPGWYQGRTTHIHFKVFLDQSNVLTGQIFFPDALSQFLYENVAPYNERTVERDTLNANDNIAAQATRASFAYVKELADAYLVAMIIGVDPNATTASGAGREPPAPPAGGFGSGEGAMSFPATEPSVSLVPGVKGLK